MCLITNSENYYSTAEALPFVDLPKNKKVTYWTKLYFERVFLN